MTYNHSHADANTLIRQVHWAVELFIWRYSTMHVSHSCGVWFLGHMSLTPKQIKISSAALHYHIISSYIRLFRSCQTQLIQNTSITRGKVLSWEYRSPQKRNSRPPTSVILCWVSWVENVLLIYYASSDLLVCLHWKKNPRFMAFLDSNLHTRLAIVTKNELGLAFSP